MKGNEIIQRLMDIINRLELNDQQLGQAVFVAPDSIMMRWTKPSTKSKESGND